MSEINGEVRVSGVYGGVATEATDGSTFKAVSANKNLPVKTGGFMTKVKAFLFQEIDWNKEIKVELTPYQQKVEDEINDFLHQEITWSKVKAFLFQDVKFGKNK